MGKVIRSTVDSEILLAGDSGVGSTNTAIRRFTTVTKNTGSPYMTLTQSATLGDSITINTTGRYAITATGDMRTGSTPVTIGVSKNSGQLSTAIESITSANRIAIWYAPAVGGAGETVPQASYAGWLTAGDVIRIHSGPNESYNGTVNGIMALVMTKLDG